MTKERIEVEAALRLALEVLTDQKASPQSVGWMLAITYIKEALMSFQDGVQPVVASEQSTTHGEPYGWADATGFVHVRKTKPRWPELGPYNPVYTAPPQRPSRSDMTWAGLTDDEIINYADGFLDEANALCVLYFARAIEAKLKEKNQ